MVSQILVIIFGIALQVTLVEVPKNKVELGKFLFFEPILSIDSTISCGSCHKPGLAFADSVAISPGVKGRQGTRNTPSVMNMASRNVYFYDGRASQLRNQIPFPISDYHEMDFSYPQAVKRLQNNKKYKSYFETIYRESPNETNVADAIALFMESLETSDTDFDAWMQDKPNTMSVAAKRGRKLFISNRAKCFDCHFSPDFTGDEFKNIGLYDEKQYKDKGRYLMTKDKNDLGKFKVPGLRNVALTAPYMHDGSFKTLESVIDFYSDPYKFVTKPINMDTSLVTPLRFTSQEKQDLLAFLHSLTDKSFLKK